MRTKKIQSKWLKDFNLKSETKIAVRKPRKCPAKYMCTKELSKWDCTHSGTKAKSWHLGPHKI